MIVKRIIPYLSGLPSVFITTEDHDLPFGQKLLIFERKTRFPKMWAMLTGGGKVDAGTHIHYNY